MVADQALKLMCIVQWGGFEGQPERTRSIYLPYRKLWLVATMVYVHSEDSGWVLRTFNPVIASTTAGFAPERGEVF